jgi:hypothetical protein
MDNRVFSFSVVQKNIPAIIEIEKLKKYANRTGISFSHLIIKAITILNKELELDNERTKS